MINLTKTPNNPPPKAPSTMDKCMEEALEKLDKAQESARQMCVLQKEAWQTATESMDMAESCERAIKDNLTQLLEPIQKHLAKQSWQETDVLYLQQRIEDQQEWLHWYEGVISIKEEDKQQLLKDVASL